MGVKGAWPFVRRKGYFRPSEPKVTQKSTNSKIRVDVCSSHNNSIRYLYSNLSDINHANRQLELLLQKIGDKEQVRYYIDGDAAAEKSQTHTNRLRSRQRALTQGATALADLKSRLLSKLRIRKFRIFNVHKKIRQAFHWSLEHRSSFVQYMTTQGYDIILCPTESDVLIASECQPQDAVVTCDSDLLFYKSIPTVWRPVGSFKARRFIPYEKSAMLNVLGLSTTQLTALAIISGNDYIDNIFSLAIETNAKIIKNKDGDERSIVRQYLADPEVVRKTNKQDEDWTEHSYENAFKVFVEMKQNKATSLPSSEAGAVTYADLQGQMKVFMDDFKNSKDEAHRVRSTKRTTTNPPANPFHTPIKSNTDLRPRYSPKIRYEPSAEQPPPAVLRPYRLKPWKKPPERPSPSKPGTKKPADVKEAITEQQRFERREIINALTFEHPIRTLPLGQLSTNVHAVNKDLSVAKDIIECIRGAVQVAWDTKRRCQILIGLYLEDLFYPRLQPGAPRPAMPVISISKDDQAILNNLCPLITSKDMTGGSDEHVGDGSDDSSNTPFIQRLLSFLYSGNRTAGHSASSIETFINRLRTMGHLTDQQLPEADVTKNVMEYTPDFLVRSIASQVSAELRRHYKQGTKALSEKIQKLIDKGQLVSSKAVDLKSKDPTIQLFVQANAIVGRPWRLSPLSPVERGFMTFTEVEIGAFLQKRYQLQPTLKKLVGIEDEQRRLSQAELIRDWLPVQTPGLMIQRLLAPLDPKAPSGDRLRGRQKKRAGLAAAVRIVEPEEIRTHVNSLRQADFNPGTYKKDGYFLRGSIRTDGYSLQLLAFKLCELNSVRYKRYRTDLLPDRLLSTTAGTTDFLTEVHNVFETSADVERLLGCTPDKVSYLGIDPGQAYVVGAYAHLAQDMVPKFGKRQDHRRRKKRGSRGHRKRGSGKGKKSVCRAQDQRHINLAAKQKAVMRPTLTHRAWMQRQKGIDLLSLSTGSGEPNISDAATAETFSISTIESSLPPLCGTGANFADHIEHQKANHAHLDKFYNGQQHRFKKYKRMSRLARARDFHQLADSLLRMVGGSIGEMRREDQKVVIGFGLGDFKSTSGLSSLHSSFESYFIQTVRSLGYLVVGVNEYYTSKKCPKCKQFVAQTESIRRLYCTNCKKYMHRDIMASHNIVNIMRGQVEKGERPLYLHPVDKDNNYPWLEREGKSTSPPKDAPIPTQLASSGGRRAGRKHRAEEVDESSREKSGKRVKATVTKTTKTKATASDGTIEKCGGRGQVKSESTMDAASAMELDN